MIHSNEPQPTKITGEQWGRKVSIELPYSDTDLNELMDIFKGIAMGLGYSETSWDECITEMADKEVVTEPELSEEYIDAAIAEFNYLESLDD